MHIQQVVDKRLNLLFLWSLIRISLIISLIEGLIMLFLPKMTSVIPIQENILDTLLLVLIGSPLLWIVVLKPLVRVVAQQQKIATEQIRVNAELRMALDAHALVSICDTEGHIIYANAQFCELSGYSQEELLGQDYHVINSGYHDEAYISSIWETITQGRIWQGEVCNRNKSGQLYWVDSTITPLLDETDRPYQYISISRDISLIKEAYAQLAVFKQAVEACSEMIIITNNQGCIQYANPAFYQITGWTEATLLGRRSTELDSPNADKNSLALMQDTLQRQESWSGKLLNRFKGIESLERAGQTPPPEPMEYWAELYINPILSANGDLSGYVQIQRNVTEQVTLEALEEMVQEDTRVRLEIAKVLQQSTPFKTRCLLVLSLIFNIHSLKLQQKGGMFLRAEGEEKLSLFVLKGRFGDESIEKDPSIVSISLLCNRASESGEILVSDDCYCDPWRDHKLPNLQVHGHYIIPLAVSGNTLGVLFLCTDPHPVKNDSRLTMLKQVGEMLALAVLQERARLVLEEARDLALKTAVAKSEFLANMSHEIRTPMNGVLGMLDILRDTEMSQGQTELVETAYASAEALLAILNDILDLSKLEAGKVEIEKIDFNLATLIEDVCSLFAVPAFTKGLELNCFIPVELPHYWAGDANRIRQVLTNLIGNAVKFTERGEVSVAVKSLHNPENEAALRFEIRDTGIGISPETQAHLFQVFTQADSSTSRRFGGTGLGLSISKILVELMGGTIGVDSELNKGACFWFSLPLARLENEVELPARIELKDKRVLVVDDNMNNRIILEHYVTSWGMTVSSVDNASAALLALMEAKRRAKPIDILLSDLQMPFMDGLALARTLCEIPAIAETPRLLLTSGGIGSEAEYKALGFSQSLTKPVRQAQLFEAIAKALRPVAQRPERDPINLDASESINNKEIWTDYSEKQVLVAEDNRVNQKVILAMLARFKLKPDLAVNGQEALDRLADKHYDLVLMDCEMPVMGGYEATTLLRERERANPCSVRTPVIALTAHATLGARETSLAAGMDGHLSKPVERNALAETLAHWFSSGSDDKQGLTIVNLNRGQTEGRIEGGY